MYLAWKAGASAAIALQIRDSKFSRETRFERDSTGIYFYNDEPKPSAKAFRFPFVAERSRNGKSVKLWGKAPKAGRIVIEQQRGKRWKPVTLARAGSSHVFEAKARIQGKVKLRASIGTHHSLGWKLK